MEYKGTYMKKRFFSSKELLILSMAGLLASYTGSAAASAFQLFEENGVGVGDFDAGGAAIAEDASTGFYNPAGLVRLDHQQVLFSVDPILSDIDVHGKDTWRSTQSPKEFPEPGAIPPPITFRGTSQGGGASYIPSFAYAAPITDGIVFGFNVTIPDGLSTEYSNNDFTRYNATYTELSVLDLSPSVGFKITDQFSAGVGFDAEKLNAELDSVAGLPSAAVAGGLSPNAFDTLSENHAADWGYGWHAGLLYQFTPQTRVGLAYHSQVVFHPTGTSSFVGPLANTPDPIPPAQGFELGSNASTSITMPGFATLSAYQDVTAQWAVYGSVNYTQWSCVKNLTLNDLAAVEPEEIFPPVVPPPIFPAQINVNIPQHFHDTWRIALGSSYQINPDWLVRAGVGYDQNPTNSTDRNIRLPDGNRFALAIGGHWQATKALGFDVGYTHLFVQHVSLDSTAVTGPQASKVVGYVDPSGDIIGLQATYDII